MNKIRNLTALCVLAAVMLTACGGKEPAATTTEKKTLPGITTVGKTETEPVSSTSAATTPALMEPEADVTAPVITGASDRRVEVGASVLYRSGVSAEDDRDGTVSVSVDSSQVDPTRAGVYPVTYWAADAAGNRSSVTVNFIFTEPTQITVTGNNGFDASGYELDALVTAVYKEIITPGMSEREKAEAVWRWTRSNIKYSKMEDMNEHDSAVYAFVMKKGNCIVYFSAAKQLLLKAGLEQIDVVKKPVEGHALHYWQLVKVDGAWWHFDSTPRAAGGDFCLWTDYEMESYSREHDNCFNMYWDRYPHTPVKLTVYYVTENGQEAAPTETRYVPYGVTTVVEAKSMEGLVPVKTELTVCPESIEPQSIVFRYGAAQAESIACGA